MAEGFSLADQLVNRDTVSGLIDRFSGVFDTDLVTEEICGQLDGMALKERLNLVADMLERHLASDFPTVAAQLRAAMPPALDPTKTDDDFGQFIHSPLGLVVERQALDGHFDLGLDLTEELTQRFSMEFTLRAFLNHDQDRTMSRVHRWTGHENYHVRRLASEGTRPRLPWGQNVGLKAADTLPVLDALHADRTRFVTRSVANHLNDLTKSHADAVLDRLDAWVEQGRQSQKELLWMRKHSLRNLIKAGHPRAMIHLGYAPDVRLNDPQISIPDSPARGDKVAVRAQFTPGQNGPLMVDYIIDYQKATGKTSPKVFKLKAMTGKAGEQVVLTKQHFFKDTATTFRLYPGAHRIQLQINGRIVARQDFDLR